MVLEVKSDARQVDKWLDTGLAELLRVAYIELAKSMVCSSLDLPMPDR